MLDKSPFLTSNNLLLTRSHIDRYLLDYCQGEIDRADALHPHYGRLWQAVAAHIENGGKRLRPYLVVMAYEAFGGEEKSSIIRVASAWELLHVAMLMHDDIIDRDYIRHGHPNVAGQYLEHYSSIVKEEDRYHYADSSALMAGDLLISAAYDLINGSDFSAVHVRHTSKLLHEAIFSVVGGELLDVEAGAISLNVTPQVIAEAKTAGYSMIGPLVTGAVLAGASENVQRSLREFGLILGVGFQYVDDVLGIFGDQEITGKSVMSDLEEGKRTFVVASTLELMEHEDRLRAEYLLGRPSKDGALELRDLITNTNIKDIISIKIADFHARAMSHLDTFNLEPAHRDAFEAVIDTILRRQM